MYINGYFHILVFYTGYFIKEYHVLPYVIENFSWKFGRTQTYVETLNFSFFQNLQSCFFNCMETQQLMFSIF